MSKPREPDPVKLMASLFSPDPGIIQEAIKRIIFLVGPTDWISPQLLFDRTRYYVKEMGWPLYRHFVSFSELVSPEHLVEIKLETNRIEEQFVNEGNRQVNIDPGYISAERLVLATGKNYVHRIYLNKGIFADLTLVFKQGTFQALDWTYRDYADPETVCMFNAVRERYMEQVRERRKPKAGL